MAVRVVDLFLDLEAVVWAEADPLAFFALDADWRAEALFLALDEATRPDADLRVLDADDLAEADFLDLEAVFLFEFVSADFDPLASPAADEGFEVFADLDFDPGAGFFSRASAGRPTSTAHRRASQRI